MNELHTLLDRVYELEGLIQLAVSREGDAPARIYELIMAKGEAVSRALSDYGASVNESEETNPLAEAEDLMSYSLEEEAEVRLPVADPEAQASLEQQEKVLEEADKTLVGSEDAMSAMAYSTELGSVESEEETEAEEEEMAEAAETEEVGLAYGPAVYESKSEVRNDTVSGSRRLRSLFSINDRFRFSRELFGGSTRRFDDTLAYLDGAIDFNEVEDFFITDQKMDPDSEVVREFLDILSRSFGA